MSKSVCTCVHKYFGNEDAETRRVYPESIRLKYVCESISTNIAHSHIDGSS